MARFDIDIRNFAFGGEAYGVLPSGKGCFVRGAVPGENVTVEITSEHARFVRAELICVNKISPDRIEPVCPFAANCPGCSYGHISYEKEIFWKQNSFERFLLGTGCVEKAAILPPVSAPGRFNWRNKIKLAVENGACGYRGTDNVSLVPVGRCLLVHPSINAYLADRNRFDDGNLELRYTPSGGVICLTPENRDDIIYDTLPGYGDFPVPAGAFFQTNPQVAALLVDKVVDLISRTGVKELIELHCGAGMFSLCAAMKIPGLTTCGAEITARSITCARKAAKNFKLSGRCSFLNSEAAKFYRTRKNCRLLLVDPPRSGLDPKLLSSIVKNPPEFMIYVSCGPDTLQRDLKKLSSSGLKVLSTQLFDMFPCTSHFESVTFLRKG